MRNTQYTIPKFKRKTIHLHTVKRLDEMYETLMQQLNKRKPSKYKYTITSYTLPYPAIEVFDEHRNKLIVYKV